MIIVNKYVEINIIYSEIVCVCFSKYETFGKGSRCMYILPKLYYTYLLLTIGSLDYMAYINIKQFNFSLFIDQVLWL